MKIKRFNQFINESDGYLEEPADSAFNEILDGKYDQYPEAAFNLKGGIHEVVAAGEKMLAEA